MSDFLERWSRRKRAVVEADRRAPPPEPRRPEAPAAPVAPEAPAEGPPSLSEAEAESLSDAEALSRLGLPDPRGLEFGADFRAFLRAGVPRRLQRLALRRLWAVTPAQAALDGLVDYADDYTDAAVAVAELSTNYEVGRGLKRRLQALAEKTAEADKGAEVGPEAGACDAAETRVERRAEAQRPIPDENPREIDVSAQKPEPSAQDQPLPQDEEPPRRSRRMAFRFEEE